MLPSVWYDFCVFLSNFCAMFPQETKSLSFLVLMHTLIFVSSVGLPYVNVGHVDRARNALPVSPHPQLLPSYGVFTPSFCDYSLFETQHLSPSPSFRYDRDKLFSYNCGIAEPSPSLVKTLKEFGIARNLPKKARRSRRGGRAERRKAQQQKLLVCTFNAQSLGVTQARKRTEINTFISDNDIDVMLISETWLHSAGDEPKLKDLAPKCYSVHSFARDSLGVPGRGGGIVLVAKDSVMKGATFKQSPLHHPAFEAAVLSANINRTRLNIACVYRVPPSKKNKLTHSMFF